MAAKRTARRQRYKVNVSMKAWDIAKAGSGINLEVRDRDELLGTIEIGQGAFYWTSSRRRRPRKIGWRSLANMLDNGP
jgi:hypothetical protein